MPRSTWPAGWGAGLRGPSSSLVVFGTLPGGRKANESEPPWPPSEDGGSGHSLARAGGVPQAPPDHCASTLLCTFMMCAVGPLSDR